MPHEGLSSCSHYPNTVWKLISAEWRSAPPLLCLQRERARESVCVVEVWWGLGRCSGRALGELQDVHLAAGHRAHYHSRTWSHQRTEERANILLKCHCQQACERTRKHIHKRQTAHTLEHPPGIYTPTKNMAAHCSTITRLGSTETCKL